MEVNDEQANIIMKEQLTQDDDPDPLNTMTKQDMKAVSRIISSELGYPVDGPWSVPESKWHEVLLTRIDLVTRANNSVHEFFAEKYGEESDLAISTGIVANITKEVTEIAYAQLAEANEDDRGVEAPREPKSWRESDRKTADFLSVKIDSILFDTSNKKFFENNPTIRDGLLLIKDVLVPSNDPDKIMKAYSEYTDKCLEANRQGKIILYIPFESDYTQPARNESERTLVCEASLALLFPLDAETQKHLDRVDKDSWNLLRQKEYAEKDANPLEVLAGDSVMGAGFEALSATSGQAFSTDSDNKTKEGYYFAVNNVDKKRRFWEISGQIIEGLTEAEMDESLRPYFVLLYVPHEQGHQLFPVISKFGEIPADIAALTVAFKELGDLKPKQLVRAILTEYISEIVNNTPQKGLFEGYHPQENPLFAGYLLSGVIVANALAESGLIKTWGGKINIDLSRINEFTANLEETNRAFREASPEMLKKIEAAVLNPKAAEIVNLYRQVLKPTPFLA